MASNPSVRMADRALRLPPVAAPVAAYVPALRTGQQVRTSGQLPFVDGTLPATGKVGAEIDPADAYAYARQAGLNALAAAASVAGGIDNITSILHVTVFVASAPDFVGQPQVANGVSDLLAEIFSEAGVHTRSAVGVAVLPLDSPVEVELLCLVS